MQIIVTTNQKLDLAESKNFFLANDPVIKESWPEAKNVSELERAVKAEYSPALYKKVESFKDEVPVLNKAANAIAEVLEEKWDEDIKVTAYIAACPIASRFLDTNSFLLPYYFANDILINWATHEMIHFLYFKKWAKMFPDAKKEEFEFPHPVWILSEILCPIIENDPRIKDIINTDSNIYEAWQEVEIEGQLLQEFFTNLYQSSKDITSFIANAWDVYKKFDQGRTLTAELIKKIS